MTAIIGYSNSKGVWLGADSAVTLSTGGRDYTDTDGYSKIRRLTVNLLSRKVPMLIGIAGSLVGETFLLKELKKAARRKGVAGTGKKFVLDILVPLVNNKEIPEDDRPDVVVGMCGNVYELYTDGVLEMSSGIAVAGSGDVVCRAAMLATKFARPRMGPEALIRNALSVAHTLMPGSVGPPFRIMKL